MDNSLGYDAFVVGFGASLLDLAKRAGKIWWAIVVGGVVGIVAFYETFIKDLLPDWDWIPSVLSFLGDLGALPLVVAVIAAFLWAYYSLWQEKSPGVAVPTVTYKETRSSRSWKIEGLPEPESAIKALLSRMVGATGAPGGSIAEATQLPGDGSSDVTSSDVESP